MSNTVLQRVVRRETHSPRTVAAVLVLVTVSAAAVLAGIEIVRDLAGRDPMLLSPGAGLQWLADLPQAQPAGAVIAGGAIAVAVGLILIWLALAPGRRPKQAMAGCSTAVVCDNGVIASSIAEQVRRTFDLARGAVVVGVGSRSIDVTARPEPGQSIEKARLRRTAEEELARYDLSRTLTVHVRIAKPIDEEGDVR